MTRIGESDNSPPILIIIKRMKKQGVVDKIPQSDKYYRINADFGYLSEYNYEITKEIGRGGYGVVYKVQWR